MTRRIFLIFFGSPLAGCLGCGSSSNPVFNEYECFLCKGEGTVRCTGCFGQGVKISFKSATEAGPSETCDICSGTGKMQCQTCKGKGKLSNNPLAQ